MPFTSMYCNDEVRALEALHVLCQVPLSALYDHRPEASCAFHKLRALLGDDGDTGDSAPLLGRHLYVPSSTSEGGPSPTRSLLARPYAPCSLVPSLVSQNSLVRNTIDTSSLAVNSQTSISSSKLQGTTPKSQSGHNKSAQSSTKLLVEVLNKNETLIEEYLSKSETEAIRDELQREVEDPRVIDLKLGKKPTQEARFRKGLSERSLALEYDEWQQRTHQSSKVSELVQDLSASRDRRNGHVSEYLSLNQSRFRDQDTTRKGVERGMKLLVFERLFQKTAISAVLSFACRRFRAIHYEELHELKAMLSKSAWLTKLVGKNSSWYNGCQSQYDARCRELSRRNARCELLPGPIQKRRRQDGKARSQSAGSRKAARPRYTDSRTTSGGAPSRLAPPNSDQHHRERSQPSLEHGDADHQTNIGSGIAAGATPSIEPVSTDPGHETSLVGMSDSAGGEPPRINLIDTNGPDVTQRSQLQTPINPCGGVLGGSIQPGKVFSTLPSEHRLIPQSTPATQPVHMADADNPASLALNSTTCSSVAHQDQGWQRLQDNVRGASNGQDDQPGHESCRSASTPHIYGDNDIITEQHQDERTVVGLIQRDPASFPPSDIMGTHHPYSGTERTWGMDNAIVLRHYQGSWEQQCGFAHALQLPQQPRGPSIEDCQPQGPQESGWELQNSLSTTCYPSQELDDRRLNPFAIRLQRFAATQQPDSADFWEHNLSMDGSVELSQRNLMGNALDSPTLSWEQNCGMTNGIPLPQHNSGDIPML